MISNDSCAINLKSVTILAAQAGTSMNFTFKLNKYLLLLIIGIYSSNICISQNKKLDALVNLQSFVAAAIKEEWKTKKQKEGITISYRNLELFDTIKTRELMLKFIVSGTIDSIISQIKQPGKLLSWNEGIRNATMLQDNDNNWILHTVYKIPWPLSKQDIVAHYSIEQRNDTIRISSKSLPDFIKPLKGSVREGYNLTQWLIVAKNNSLFDIEFSAISLTNSSIPRWIKDPLIRKMLIKSFSGFRNNLL